MNLGDTRLPPNFWTKVQPDDEGCWRWTAATNGGYGIFAVNRKPKRAHRIAYEMLIGEIPEGLQLDHLCRVRNCVNPKHLEPVAHQENIRRGEGFSAQKARQTHCIHGHIFDEENTAWIKTPGNKPQRRCRECERRRARQYYHRNKAQNR